MFRQLLYATVAASLLIGGIAGGTWLVRTAEPPPMPTSTSGVNSELRSASPPDADPPPKKRQWVRPLAVPNDFVLLARDDARRLPPGDVPFMRYVANQHADQLSARTAQLAGNYASRATTISFFRSVGGGRLLRVDLRDFVRTGADLEDWFNFWEEFAFDPSFNLIVTKDTIRFLKQEEIVLLPVTVEKKVKLRRVVVPGRVENKLLTVDKLPFVAPDGNSYANLTVGTQYNFELHYPETSRDVEEVFEETVNVIDAGQADAVRLNPGHVDPVALAELQVLTRSQAPVVDHLYFKTRILSTIKDAGVFKKVWGGLYYDFRGVKKVKKGEKGTDLDLFFESLGIGLVRAGFTADELFDNLQSDRRTVLFRSEISGKPRDVLLINVPAAGDGTAKGAITGDIKDKDVDVGDRSFANLLNPRRAAREAIFPGPNGLDVFALFNGDGALQDEVPPDVAANHLKPAPYPKRLQGAMDCIWCHQVDGSGGWKPLKNDIRTLADAREIDIFDDRSDRKKSQLEVITRLRGAYNGNFDKDLRRAREDVAEATMRATSLIGVEQEVWPVQGEIRDIASVASKRLVDEYVGYNYTLVDAREALRDLGYDVPADLAPLFFRLVLPRDARGRVGDFIPEDVRIAAIRGGIPILRSDWALSYSFAAERVRANLQNPVIKREVEKWLER